MSLRSRVMVAFAYLLLLAVIALSVPLGIQVARRARDDFAVRLNNWAERVAVDAPDAMDDPEALHALVSQRPDLGRVIVTNRRGKLIGDSISLRPLGTDYAMRSEIIAALQGRPTRFVRSYESTGLQYLVTVPILDDGRVIGTTRVSQPVAEVDREVRQRLLYLAAGSFAVLFIVLLVSVAIARSLTRPLRHLGDVASRIGEGELGAQAEESGQREVAEVAVALNTMSRRIEQSMQAQSDFVANASHQLRTPLTGLRLRLEALEASGVEAATPALQETDRLARLVNDLLTLVRIGSEPEVAETADLGQIAADAADRWRAQAAEADHHLALQSRPGPCRVAAAAGDLSMVVDNLIENALKYTPAGTTVTISVADQDDDEVLLMVADDGPGMSPADREHAFDRFYRGARGKAVTGTGLGLAIVRQLVERWGGTVDVRNGDGTRFEVRVPAADAEDARVDTTDPLPSLS